VQGVYHLKTVAQGSDGTDRTSLLHSKWKWFNKGKTGHQELLRPAFAKTSAAQRFPLSEGVGQTGPDGWFQPGNGNGGAGVRLVGGRQESEGGKARAIPGRCLSAVATGDSCFFSWQGRDTLKREDGVPGYLQYIPPLIKNGPGVPAPVEVKPPCPAKSTSPTPSGVEKPGCSETRHLSVAIRTLPLGELPTNREADPLRQDQLNRTSPRRNSRVTVGCDSRARA